MPFEERKSLLQYKENDDDDDDDEDVEVESEREKDDLYENDEVL